MAIISSERSLNVQENYLALSTLSENEVGSEFLDDESTDFRGNTYEDVIYVATEVDASAYLWAFGGSKFKFNDDGDAIGGTVSAIAIFDYDSAADEPASARLVIENIRTPLKSLGSAAGTATLSDDTSVWERILSGSDTISLSDDDDFMVGLGGDDSIDGNGGDDTLIGGSGRDTLTGGDGSDLFIFETRASKKNLDIITDFDAANDLLIFEIEDFRVLDEGPLAEDQFVTGSVAVDADDYFVYSNGTLFYDADGSGKGKAVAIVTLTGSPALTFENIAAYLD
jgi:Ca2+-binding RTX toxin-like protein